MVAKKKSSAPDAAQAAALPADDQAVVDPKAEAMQANNADITKAVGEIAKHDKSEQRVTGAYWRLGKAIQKMEFENLCEKGKLPDKVLADLGVDATRKSRALDIAKFFHSAEEAAEVSLNKAMADIRAAKPAAAKKVESVGTKAKRMVKSLEELAEKIEGEINDDDEHAEAVAAIADINKAIAELQKLIPDDEKKKAA